MKKPYALDYLEHLITEQLNPRNLFLPEEDLQEELIEKIAVEKHRVQAQIKGHVFGIKNDEHCAALVKKYYEALVSLIDIAYSISKNQVFENSKNQQVIEFALVTLEEVLRNVELHYRRYLDAEIRVPQKELEQLKSDILKKIEIIPENLSSDGNSKVLIDLVMNGIHFFIKKIDDQDVITQKEASYHLGFVNDLYGSFGRFKIIPECPSLHEIILYWNFNSREVIGYLSNELEQLIAQQDSPENKIEFIRMHFMRLLHLPARPKTLYNVELPGLKSYFTNQMRNQREFYETFIGTPSRPHPIIEADTPAFKVMINLSADQIAILIRLFFDLNILLSKSLSLIFETIVKAMSTPRKASLSWTNVRSKSYNPEKRDVDILIKLMERGIKILQEY